MRITTVGFYCVSISAEFSITLIPDRGPGFTHTAGRDSPRHDVECQAYANLVRSEWNRIVKGVRRKQDQFAKFRLYCPVNNAGIAGIVCRSRTKLDPARFVWIPISDYVRNLQIAHTTQPGAGMGMWNLMSLIVHNYGPGYRT